MNTQPSPPASDGTRTPDGKFAPGNNFGRGNPHLKRVHALKNRMLAAVDEGAIERITVKLVEMAEGGDIDAIRLLYSYVLGKPASTLEVTGPDSGPLIATPEILDRAARELDEWRKSQMVKLVKLQERDKLFASRV